jgi:hypothetical protein
MPRLLARRGPFHWLRRAFPKASPFKAALLAAPLLALGCSQDLRYAPICPQMAILSDGADLIRFNGPGRDLTDRVLEARIQRVDATCEPGRGNTVVAHIKVWFDITRGPASKTRNAQVPYFIAVTRGEQVVDHRAYSVNAAFGANVDIARVGGSDIDLTFPARQGQGAEAYKIYVSLQLTQEELQHIRDSR